MSSAGQRLDIVDGIDQRRQLGAIQPHLAITGKIIIRAIRSADFLASSLRIFISSM
ncbi:hypothetical protein M3P05_14955 [Sansalvadorimonas sp. 2012CJ34-2]|uniref:Uncharacterized protein n=1 Tax=Parendozoicomonas callyspongiae TaxID=2942213 RepID=A0ABT0PIS3_9GAMM|nr:hypothetical protein [Sansalvadorimonas sp. 2012CJ34-2]MCL6271223.1 hypothetical protein [Sansalvadorimonas sp. 2012CJ34-2]